MEETAKFVGVEWMFRTCRGSVASRVGGCCMRDLESAPLEIHYSSVRGSNLTPYRIRFAPSGAQYRLETGGTHTRIGL